MAWAAFGAMPGFDLVMQDLEEMVKDPRIVAERSPFEQGAIALYWKIFYKVKKGKEIQARLIAENPGGKSARTQ